MASILFVTHQQAGSLSDGPGLRAIELARLLAREHQVTLALSRPADQLSPGVQGLVYRFGEADSLRPALQQATLLIAGGSVLAGHPELATCELPLVLDLSDPTILENLALRDSADRAQWRARSQAELELLRRQLLAADCILCATERQRDFYLGVLLAAGRVDLFLAAEDASLGGFLQVLPCGLPTEAPQPLPVPWPVQAPGSLVVLWSGGIWDWQDPLTLIQAWPAVITAIPHARLVFLAGRPPGSNESSQMPARARALASQLGLLEQSVIFVERWLPFAERAAGLLNAALAVCLRPDRLERRYAAVDSGFLDHLWAGLPSLVSEGDSAAELVRKHGLGRVVTAGDSEATTAALIELLQEPSLRHESAARARVLAAEFTWEHVARPLLDFCRSPRRAPAYLGARPAYDLAVAVQGQLAARDQQAQLADQPRNHALAALEALRVLKPPQQPSGLLPRLRQRLFNWLLAPELALLREQQNAYNAALVRALSALAESGDQRRSESYAMFDIQSGRLAAAELHLADLDDADSLLAERINALAAQEQRKL